jgi:erythronate-4-phosphate dehydrogenase
MKIAADNKIPFLQGLFEPFCDVVYLPGNKISKSDLIDAEALIIRTRTKCNADLLEGTRVKFIATATIGFDHIDTEYCDSHDIVWTNAPGCNSGSVQQWFMSSLLYLARQKNIDLKNRTLGVIGVGNVGQKIVRFAEAMQMQVLLNDPPRAEAEGRCGFVDLKTLLQESDIVTLHVPLTKSGGNRTFHMVDSTFLNRLNPKTILVNSSRGEVVKTKDLIEYSGKKLLDGLMLDVWENEPDIDMDLLNLTNIATPHIAGYSVDGKALGTAMAVNALSKYFGLPLDNWYPEGLPLVGNMTIDIDAKGLSVQEIVTIAIQHTYPVLDDTNLLRNNLSEFEQLRGNYRIRREPKAWKIKLSNADKQITALLKEIGFEVQ